jgi:hypothetical protein
MRSASAGQRQTLLARKKGPKIAMISGPLLPHLDSNQEPTGLTPKRTLTRAELRLPRDY